MTQVYDNEHKRTTLTLLLINLKQLPWLTKTTDYLHFKSGEWFATCQACSFRQKNQSLCNSLIMTNQIIKLFMQSKDCRLNLRRLITVISSNCHIFKNLLNSNSYNELTIFAVSFYRVIKRVPSVILGKLNNA